MFNKKIAKMLDMKKTILASAEELQALGDDDSNVAVELSEDDQMKFDALLAEAANIDKKVESLQALEKAHDTIEVAKAIDATDAEIVAAVQVGDDNKAHDPTGGFDHMGSFAMSVMGAFNPADANIDERLMIIQASVSGMSQSIGADGGFLVPPAFSSMIWNKMAMDEANLLAKTDNFTVEGESLTFNGVDETSRATGSRQGGVRGYWLAEADQMTKSKPTFRQVKIEPKQLAVMIFVTDKLLNNSPIALEQFLTRAAANEIGFMTSDAIINGDGSGKPKGILTSGAKIEIAKETDQEANTIVKENIDNMWSRCHARWRQGAVWYINQDAEPTLANMNMSVGTGGAPVYLPAGGISAAPFATLKGRPVMPIEFCSTVGTAGDIILANLGAYVTGTRGGIKSAMSMHLRFDYNEKVFRFIFEVDGQPWIASPLTPFKGANTLSPFVTLADRS